MFDKDMMLSLLRQKGDLLILFAGKILNLFVKMNFPLLYFSAPTMNQTIIGISLEKSPANFVAGDIIKGNVELDLQSELKVKGQCLFHVIFIFIDWIMVNDSWTFWGQMCFFSGKANGYFTFS